MPVCVFLKMTPRSGYLEVVMLSWADDKKGSNNIVLLPAGTGREYEYSSNI